MSGRIFIDTNILVYAYTSGDAEKHEVAKRLLQNTDDDFVISTQVLNELYVTLAKHKIDDERIAAVISEVSTFCEVRSVGLETVNIAIAVKKRYGFSYWDSLILAASLENGCALLYSKDMADGQIIDSKELGESNIKGNIQIKNPLCQQRRADFFILYRG